MQKHWAVISVVATLCFVAPLNASENCSQTHIAQSPGFFACMDRNNREQAAIDRRRQDANTAAEAQARAKIDRLNANIEQEQERAEAAAQRRDQAAEREERIAERRRKLKQQANERAVVDFFNGITNGGSPNRNGGRLTPQGGGGYEGGRGCGGACQQ